ncbi:metalloregulator ArsR/SmtB family transcription factor [Isoptericola sp. b441]|uniref:Metalloregulator ArsR/SmtB family transcription factor n=1 Tax=Actinotalea lenta TaxID=3064654 RepID=A0ABT9DBW9_9CELL|nr:metalloregulator ArsR/SmtB family transcription factor [Isoptericola sp. b441]MDO8106693.1 metalloregulator ArsR/SmtB family transcription factor [Isoptericola sp. b441]
MSADAQTPSEAVDPTYVEIAVEVFAMLADATRLRIVLALSAGEHTVGELAEAVGKSPTSVSQHLAKLRLARMVAARQDGNHAYYRLINDHAGRLVVDALQQAEHAVEATPRHHREQA